MKATWKVETTIDFENGTIVTKVVNPDGSWGVIHGTPMPDGQVVMVLVDHSADLDVNAFQTGMNMSQMVQNPMGSMH